LGALTIFSLGTVITDKKKFHHKRYIWPVGFKSSRSYASLKDFNQRCDYINEIVDGGSEPKFIVTCKDDPDNPIISATASGAWTEIVKRINDQKREMTGKRMFTTVSGPEMFGYAHPSIAKLIQDLPGAELCDKYLRQEFILASEKKNQNKKKTPKTEKDEDEEESEDSSSSSSDDEMEDIDVV